MTEKKWHIVYTKPRNEKKVAERLREMNIEVYCPLQTSIRQWSDRKRKVKIPVIPSYVFMKIDDARREDIVRVPGVSRFVFWLGKPAIAKDKEIDSLRIFLDNNSKMELEVSFEIGNSVKIVDGVFKEEEGVFLGKKQGKAIIILPNLGMKLIANKQNLELINS